MRLLDLLRRARREPTYDEVLDQLLDAETRCLNAEEKTLELLEVIEEGGVTTEALREMAFAADHWELRHRYALNFMTDWNRFENRWPLKWVGEAKAGVQESMALASHARHLAATLDKDAWH